MNDETLKQFQAIYEHNQLIEIQLWILGGLVVAFLAALVYFSKNSYEEIKLMIKNSDQRLNQHDVEIATMKVQGNVGREIRDAGQTIADAIDATSKNIENILNNQR